MLSDQLQAKYREMCVRGSIDSERDAVEAGLIEGGNVLAGVMS